MEQSARAAGAVFEIRDGWNVAVGYGTGADQEAEACRRTAGWADVSPLGKLELQAPAASWRRSPRSAAPDSSSARPSGPVRLGGAG